MILNFGSLRVKTPSSELLVSRMLSICAEIFALYSISSTTAGVTSYLLTTEEGFEVFASYMFDTYQLTVTKWEWKLNSDGPTLAYGIKIVEDQALTKFLLSVGING